MFDPYYKWLGIPPSQQPPTHYRLLGIELFEADRDVIEAAANQRMAYLQEIAGGDRVRESQQLLNEIAAARRCLLNAEKKTAYDAQLRSKSAAVTEQISPPTEETAPIFPIDFDTQAIPTPRDRPRQRPQPATKSHLKWYIGGGIAAVALLLIGVLIAVSQGGKEPEPKVAARDDHPEPVKPTQKETPKPETPKKNTQTVVTVTGPDCRVHWVPKRNLAGEPVGFFSHGGAYHFFYQPSPANTNQDRWAYATSKDLLSWSEKPVKHPALFPTTAKLVAVLPDYSNSSGLGAAKDSPVVACYAVAIPAQKNAKTNDTMGLFIAHSTDHGLTWTANPQPMVKFPMHPELRVNLVRHESSQLWVAMALRPLPNAKAPEGELLWSVSKDLKTWTALANQKLPVGSEAPDLFEVPVQGDNKKAKTVLVGGNGQYFVGQFDGKTMTREGGAGASTLRHIRGGSVLLSPRGNTLRTLQIGYLPSGKTSDNSPFGWPQELTVVQNAKDQSWRLLRQWPKEMQTLRGKDQPFKDLVIGKNSKVLDVVKGSVFEFTLELEKQNANEFTLICAGEKLRYAFDKKRWFGEGYEVYAGDGKTIRLSGVVDDDVLEFHFGTYGGTAAKVRGDQTAKPLAIEVPNGTVKVKSLVVQELRAVPTTVAVAP